MTTPCPPGPGLSRALVLSTLALVTGVVLSGVLLLLIAWGWAASEKVPPRFQSYDAMNRGTANAHALRQNGDGLSILTTPTYVKHLVVCKFGLMMGFPPVLPDALIASALSPHIPVVVASRSEKQMIWAHAGWRIASVQDTDSGRNRANGHQPRSSVGQDGSPATPLIDLAISFWLPIADPQPAGARFVNQSPEPFGKRLGTFTAFESLPKFSGSGVGAAPTGIGTELSMRRFNQMALWASRIVKYGVSL